jgi:hypothetical protein
MSGHDIGYITLLATRMEWVYRIQDHQPAWLFITLFSLMGLFAWIRSQYGNILVQTIQATTSFQVAARIFLDNSVLQKQFDNLLDAFYLLSTCILLYLIEIRFGLYPYGISGIWL